MILRYLGVSVGWGMQFQQEDIDDRIHEWSLIDSAGFILPHPTDSIGLPSNNNQEVNINEIRSMSCFFIF